jgi:PilZ domain-containing protein
MDQPLTDRRQDTRFLPPLLGDTHATIRPGREVSLINLSAGGALIQAGRPLRPGSRVHLQVKTPARTFGLNAHVLRCIVSSLNAVDGVTYQGAIRFDHRCDLFWEGTTLAGSPVPPSSMSPVENSGKSIPSGRSRPSLNIWRDLK